MSIVTSTVMGLSELERLDRVLFLHGSLASVTEQFPYLAHVTFLRSANSVELRSVAFFASHGNIRYSPDIFTTNCSGGFTSENKDTSNTVYV